MKWLKSLVFMVFIMGVGVLLERASMALYERGSKVDWALVRRAFLAGENSQNTVSQNTVSQDMVANKSQAEGGIAVATEAAVPVLTPTLQVTNESPVAGEAGPLKNDKIEREENFAHDRWAVRMSPHHMDHSSNQIEPASPPHDRGLMLAIRAPKNEENEENIALAPPRAREEQQPAAIGEPTPAVRPALSDRYGIEAADKLSDKNSARYGSEPTPAVEAAKPALEPAAFRDDSAAPATPTAEAATPDKQDGEEQQRIVCHLQSVPVKRLAEELTKIFQKAPGLAIEPETFGNSLLLSGPKSLVEEAQRLIKELDHPAAMVRLEVRISEVDSAKVKKADETASEKEKSADETPKGDLFVASVTEEGTPQVRADLTTLDNQAARIFLGRMEPHVSGTVVNRAAMTNTVNTQMVGTQISLTPRMDRDNTVVLNLKIEDSRTGSSEHDAVVAVVKDAPPIRVPSTEQFKAETTVRLQDGKTLQLGGINRDGPSGRARLISVTAHVIRLGDEKTTDAEKEKK